MGMAGERPFSTSHPPLMVCQCSTSTGEDHMQQRSQAGQAREKECRITYLPSSGVRLLHLVIAMSCKWCSVLHCNCRPYMTIARSWPFSQTDGVWTCVRRWWTRLPLLQMASTLLHRGVVVERMLTMFDAPFICQRQRSSNSSDVA